MSFAYSRKTGDTAEVDQGEVEALLQRRSTLRDQGDYAAADAILRRLKNDLKVDLDDRSKMWKVRNVLGVLAMVGSHCQNNGSDWWCCIQYRPREEEQIANRKLRSTSR